MESKKVLPRYYRTDTRDKDDSKPPRLDTVLDGIEAEAYMHYQKLLEIGRRLKDESKEL